MLPLRPPALAQHHQKLFSNSCEEEMVQAFVRKGGNIQKHFLDGKWEVRPELCGQLRENVDSILLLNFNMKTVIQMLAD